MQFALGGELNAQLFANYAVGDKLVNPISSCVNLVWVHIGLEVCLVVNIVVKASTNKY